jgi:hypothetical protein
MPVSSREAAQIGVMKWRSDGFAKTQHSIIPTRHHSNLTFAAAV